jgi:hypothetical protein
VNEGVTLPNGVSLDIKVLAGDCHADRGNRTAQPRRQDCAIKNISVASQPVPGTNALLRRKQRHSILLTGTCPAR